jgi:hypothetical protein
MTTPPATAPPVNQAAPPPDPNGGPPPTTQAAAIVKREPIAVGERGVKLTSFDDIYRFARVVVASKFCPPNFNDADCFICISRGLEIGMSPMMSLEAIYIVNNRATLFGDAPKAICEASGLLEDYEQSYEGTEGTDDFRAVVTSKRRGRKPQTETFSVRDAKTAELWGKKGPWTNYPKRMLMFRARGYNLRDNFGDVLKGFQIGELVDDFDNAKQASGRVVEPNFPNGTPPPQPSAENQLPKAWQQQQGELIDLQAQKRHRRTKAEMEAERASTSSAQGARETAPAASAAPPAPISHPEPQTPPAAMQQAPPATAEPKPANGPVAEIFKRLAAEKISQEAFLILLNDLGLVDTEQTSIELGHFTVGHVAPETLKMALDDWDNVLLRLKGAAQS